MNVMPLLRCVSRCALVLALLPSLPLQAQDGAAARRVTRLVAEPATISVEAGSSTPFTIRAVDATGATVAGTPMRLSGALSGIAITNGQIRGLRAGDFEMVISTIDTTGGAPITLSIPVRVTWPAIARLELSADSGQLYAGTAIAHRARLLHADNSARPAGITTISWTSSNPDVASVDRFGLVSANRPGTAVITASAEGRSATRSWTVTANPVASLEIATDVSTIRTGDVVHLGATAKRSDGSVVRDVPVTWSYTYTPDDSIAAPGAVGVIDRGLFTGETPGRYTLLASAGNVVARRNVQVTPRDVRRRISVQGRGNITNVHTSDLWPWTGADGRDYALVGTWGGDGWAYVMDITNLSQIAKVDSVKVDARTINDVTVSPDGRYGVLSREGASTRRNGVVILDLATPAHPKIASIFEDDLTGGVHNLFATNDHLFAISGGDKYVIIDMKDIYNPTRVGEYNHPESSVHDVWVNDGIAYSSEWGTGVVAVDVGNGKWGGTISAPKLIATYPTTSGSTHEVYPYVQQSTGKVYLFLGDEIMSREGRVYEGTNYLNNINAKGGPPQTSAGYTHIVDFTDPTNPRNIAKYHQEEFGSHDIIVQDDVLYQAYYDGGLRVVDVSGELLGNLAAQGREIAVFKSYDPDGYTANATFVMNAMPWKGHVLFTDFNSGLWAAKLDPKATMVP